MQHAELIRSGSILETSSLELLAARAPDNAVNTAFGMLVLPKINDMLHSASQFWTGHSRKNLIGLVPSKEALMHSGLSIRQPGSQSCNPALRSCRPSCASARKRNESCTQALRRSRHHLLALEDKTFIFLFKPRGLRR